MTKENHREPLCIDTILPQSLQVAMAYVPFQFIGETYEPEKAFRCGTLFPELNKPFMEGRKGGSR